MKLSVNILIYNDQFSTQSISIPSGTWADLDGNSYTNSVTLNSFTSKVLYKSTALPLPTPSIPSPTPSTNISVLLQANASSNSITLNWFSYGSSTGYSIHRKLKSQTTWGNPIVTLGSTITQYTDNSVTPGEYYEYRLTRNSTLGTAYAYVSTSTLLPAIDYRGKIVVVIDNTFTTLLQSEITQLEQDLISDGWITNIIYVSSTSTPQSIRTNIQSYYNTDPSNVKAVLLLGKIPTYYSGNINPDGHTAIPWACDAFYGEMNSTWGTQTSLPSDVELMVGRIDLRLMPSFNVSEEQLLRNYLNKLHNYKIKQWTVQSRGLLMDNFFSWVSQPLAEGGYRNMGPLVGINNITTIPGYGGSFPNTVINGYLWTWSGGGGTYNSADGIASTSTYVTSQHNGVFNMTFGSYFGNWNSSTAVPNWNNGNDNFLRAPLASGQALTNVWDAQPTWFFHHMGLGDPIGYSTLITQNNRTASPTYIRQNNGWAGQGYTTVHLGLMGDPSLRMNYIAPPSNFVIQNNGNSLSFTWGSSNESSVLGYNIYKINSNNIIKINTNIITTNSFNYVTTSNVGDKYMVRAIKNITNFSGNYTDMSLGVINSVPTQNNIINLSIKIFLQGPFNGNSMSDALRALNMVPTSDPYPSLGYSHVGGGGATTSFPILTVTGVNAIVDWVIVEVRSTTSPTQRLYTTAALLQRDGDVVATDGVSPLTIPLQANSYYIAVRHRNHLGIMTASPIALSANTTLDFNTTTTYGTDAMYSSGGYKMMWAGDVTFDGVIKYTGVNNDRDPILSRIGGVTPTNSVDGYYSEDVNMSGNVKYTGQGNDRDIVLLNIGGTIPTNTRIAQLP